jgi:hypothetical protein
MKYSVLAHPKIAGAGLLEISLLFPFASFAVVFPSALTVIVMIAMRDITRSDPDMM